MNASPGKRALSLALCLALLAVTMPIDAGALMLFQGQEVAPPSTPTSAPASDYSGQGAPMTAAELQGLVAPIALYPDALVAQILSASTFPDQVAVADNWLQQNKNLTGSALMQAVNGQSWDASVKALTQFPSVLDKMAQSLAWTSSLGEAYHNQAADVMTSDHSCATGASNHRHTAHESASCLRSGIQPDGGLRNALRHTRVQHGSPCSYRPAFIWSWNGGRGNDERRLLRLGLQQLELQLARWRSLLPRRSILR